MPQDFDRDGSLPLDHSLVVVGRNVLASQQVRVFPSGDLRHQWIAFDFVDLDSDGLNRRESLRIDVLGHEDLGGDAELAAHRSGGERVIAGRGGDYAGLGLRRGKREELVSRAAQLERAGLLQVFQLEENVGAGALAQPA